jgi:murein endopeptidase
VLGLRVLVVGAVFAAAAALVPGPGTGAREEPAAPGLVTSRPPIAWLPSIAFGEPYDRGRLLNGVRLPARGPAHGTWDPVLERTPNRAWRRWGTDLLVRRLLRVARAHRAANPGAPRLLIGDLSRPRGGWFGARFGGLGHSSHQNGLDADVYYPRRDRIERAPRRVGQIDRRLAQDLVRRFVRAGAEYVFVGPRTGLRGPRGVVQRLEQHDDHLHVRFPNPLPSSLRPPRGR